MPLHAWSSCWGSGGPSLGEAERSAMPRASPPGDLRTMEGRTIEAVPDGCDQSPWLVGLGRGLAFRQRPALPGPHVLAAGQPAVGNAVRAGGLGAEAVDL